MTFHIRWLLTCLVLLGSVGFVVLSTIPSVAQTVVTLADDSPDYEAWERVANRAEEAIERSRASNNALEQLREELRQWRQLFLSSQNVNSTVIQTVQRQLDALGPPPAEGEEEAPSVMVLREQLNKRLAELRAPALQAEISFGQADGLIRGIDSLIRERQTQQILQFGASPANPAHWPRALQAIERSFADIAGETTASWANQLQQRKFRDSAPAVLLLVIIGTALIARGRRFTRRFTERCLEGNPGAGRWIVGFLLSTGSLLLPFAGYLMVFEAMAITGLAGLNTSQLLEVLTLPVFFFLGARWLGSRIFPAKEARTLPLSLTLDQRARGRWYAASLGLAAAASFFIQDAANVYSWSQEAQVVVLYPLLFICCLLLWRIAALLRAHVRANEGQDEDVGFAAKVIKYLSVILVVLCIAAPLLGLVGYFKLAQTLLYPSLATLQLLALLLILQRVVIEVYVLLTGNRDRASESLIPVLIGFLMLLVSLPLVALFWGARTADLTEIWSRIVEGVSIGETRISPAIFFTLALVFILGYFATRLLQGTLKNTILPKTKMDTGARNAVVSGVGYIGIFLAAVIAITSAGIDLSSIAIVAGALSVGIGFGLQTIVSNFVSGIILLIERPISEGDWIEVGGVHGTVRDISVRSTVIQTFDRSDVIVPNSDLVSGQVTNYTRGNTIGRLIVPVGVAYGTDTKLVENILREVAEAHPLVVMNPPPAVLFRSFGASSLDFEIRAILRDVNYVIVVQSEMLHEINRRFVEAGIEIPFAQTDLWLRNPEALRGEQSAPNEKPKSETKTSTKPPDAGLSKPGDGEADNT
ncbi:MAG: DUF3772 domain-containing protein [Pseudomonadota bacterium]